MRNKFSVRKKMADVYRDGALGEQKNSLRRSGIVVSFGKSTRLDREKLHISREHDKTTPNLESPGPIYFVNAESPHVTAYRFGTGPQRHHVNPQSGTSSIDLLGAYPDDQLLKFPKSEVTLFGTEPRDKIKNAAILREHPQAFYGMDSPGPLGYLIPDNTGKGVPSISMGLKTRSPGCQIQTPPCVGPGSYAIQTTCGGSQNNASIANQPVFSFGKAPQRPGPNRLGRSSSEPPDSATFREVSIGVQPNSRRRTVPRPVIGLQTRDRWVKQGLLLERSQSCPRIEHPRLLNRLELIKWTS